MEFKRKDLQKYEMSTVGDKLTYLCVMLEKIFDGLSQPHVVVQGDIHNPMDAVSLVSEYKRLIDENVKLKEMLRWHPVSELPKKETTNCSITVLLDIDYVGVFKVYYNFLSEIWVGVQGKQEYFRAEDFKNTKARWCYIPDDNQGTDCTPEDSDA